MTSFVSQSAVEAEKEKNKEKKRKARDEVLKEARESFEREKQRLELKRQRGDDKWLAPGLSSRLDNAEINAGIEAKAKVSKKRKKRKKNDSDSDDHEAMWVEKGINNAKSPANETIQDHPKSPARKRDDWMLMPVAPSQSSLAILSDRQTASEQQQVIQAEKLQCTDKPGQHPRELNPYWKNGGTGIPKDENRALSSSSLPSSSSSIRDQTPSVTKLNAAGRSWMLRAYKRALEQVEAEGRTLEDIATERWGSLDKLYSLLEGAGIDPKHPDAPQCQRKEYLYSSAPCHGVVKEEEEEVGKKGVSKGSTKGREDGGSGCLGKVKVSGMFMKPGEGGVGGLKGSSRGGGGATSRGDNWRRGGGKGLASLQDEGGDLREESGDQRQESSGVSLNEPGRELKEPVSTPDSMEVEVTSNADNDKNQLEDSEPVTDMQLNALSAKILKAEMVGDGDKVKALQRELEVLRTRKELQASSSKAGHKSSAGVKSGKEGSERNKLRKERNEPKEENTVILTRTDRFGNVRPFDLPSSCGYRSSQPTHSKGGKRERYFPDDNRHSLRDLLEQERVLTAEDTHAAVARMASKFVPASHLGETVDDLLDSRGAMRPPKPGKEEERERQRAVLEGRRMTEALEKCHFCVAGAGFQKHLVVAMGIGVYLCMLAHQSLVEGHCMLIPMEHTACSLHMDENVWSEVRVFQKGLTRMFSDRGMDVVFMETYMSARSKAHMAIDCVPLPRETGAMAPMYFKKAILECDEEWAQNRKLVDTQKKGLRGSVPSGLPYFSVEFGLDNGFAHVIEDADKFPRYFGREVVGGMLDVEPRLWLKPPKESFEFQKKKVLVMSEWWKPYDWTQKLKQS